jgi:cytosine/adenosine deaminase-related metal-dependent hydrolase
MNDGLDIVKGSVSIEDGLVATVGTAPAERYDAVIDGRDGWLIPGFVQTHVHLCQTLFRGQADDMPLLEWLRTRVWPLEAAHRPDTLRAATRLSGAELLLGGTTSILTMETVHDTDTVFETLAGLGLRATVGKCLMDRDGDAPRRLRERTDDALRESEALRRRWHGAAGGRLRAAFAPRFAVSCTEELLRGVAALSTETSALVHTHAAESKAEIEEVRRLTGGRTNLQYLADVGLASPRLCAAHCVWLDDREVRLVADHDVKVLHCPGSNLKLGSGIARVTELLEAGVTVSLGADGGACNNHLDMFNEMRLAATLQSVRRAPGALAATRVLWMATRGGARTLGLEREIGSIEPGKRADVVLVDRSGPHLQPGTDPYSSLVYAARPSDVRTVLVDGSRLVDDHELVDLDTVEIVAEARRAAATLVSRANL